MKYAGSITILDDEGNVAFERDLSDDEIIEALLAALPDAEEETGEPQGAAKEPRADLSPDVRACCGAKSGSRHKKACPEIDIKPFKQPELHRTVFTDEEVGIRACCGSSARGRHKAQCTEAGKNLKYPDRVGKNRRTVDNRRPFSEPTYSIVKGMLEDTTVDGIVADKGLDPDEVRRCNLADDYEDYLAIA